jgi:hypothetical protein
MRLKLMVTLISWALASHGAAASDLRHLELAADGIRQLQVLCGAGMLHVKGVRGLERIDVDAAIFGFQTETPTPSSGEEQGLRLRLYREGDRAILISEVDSEAARIDLALTVPQSIRLQIEDGSGTIEIQGIGGDVIIEDGSGRIRIADVFGRVDVVDGSGALTIEDIRGRVSVQDGSGSITVMQVAGDVNVSDGSGWIRIAKIDGNVTLSDDSGSIDIQDVTRNVIVRESGTGEVSIERVNGKVISREEP